MTKAFLPAILLSLVLVVASCSSAKVQKEGGIALSAASSGVVKNNNITFPIFLTDKIEAKEGIVAKTSPDVFIIHTGHLFKAAATKEENEAVLESLKGKSIDLVSLSVEDFIIADQQEILFEKYPQKFLNSTVIDLNEDTLVTKQNILPYVVHDGVAFIGLSDKKIDPAISMDKFLVGDYALAVLRAKKAAVKHSGTRTTATKPLHSFVIIHTIGAEIDEVMERLPPNFLDSLAD